MSLIDELRQKSAEVQEAQKQAIAKKEVERQKVIDKITNFLINKISDAKFLDQAISLACEDNQYALMNKRAGLSICVKYNCIEKSYRKYEWTGATFFIYAGAKHQEFKGGDWHYEADALKDSEFKINAEELFKLEPSQNSLTYASKSEYIDSILTTVATRLSELLKTMGFISGIKEIDNGICGISRECIATFAW